MRDWIVPTNRRYPLALLLGALSEAFPAAEAKAFVIIEYVLLKVRRACRVPCVCVFECVCVRAWAAV